MVKILFVCHGNICRSTMAECVMQNLLVKHHLEDKYAVDSAATSYEEIGNPIHIGTRKKLIEKDIPIIEHYAKRISVEDAKGASYIMGMDDANIRNLKNILPKSYHNKIFKLLDFADEKGNIADPWYTGNFDETYEDVLKGCTGFLKSLNK